MVRPGTNPLAGRRAPPWALGSRLLPLLLVLVVLGPYHRLLSGSAIPIPSDIAISDLADGELPARVEAGRIARSGELPLWTPGIHTGAPLLQLEPVTLALFAALPPSLALGWFLSLWVLAAALGTYALARQLGASRAGGFLAGVAFSWSGFLVCQLRHPGVLMVVSLFPAGLHCLERAAGGGLGVAAARELPPRVRRLWLAGFAALFGLQLLAAFPQSAYIVALVYAALVTARCVWLGALARSDAGYRPGPAAALAAGALGAAALAALIGMAQLLPLRELGASSDRGGGVTLAWATQFSYWPRNALTFLLPYATGDISDLSYTGRGSIFWEDYGYVGLTTLVLAVVALVLRLGRFAVVFWGAAALVAYGLVLGAATPLFPAAFRLLPGLSFFRLPTRFLFVVELALALLAALGLTALTELLAVRLRGRARQVVPPLLAAVIVAATAADLIWHHRRQNPLVDADRWLRTPASAAAIRAGGAESRVFSPGAWDRHVAAFYRARGWSGDLAPYFEHREQLQPNANLLHGVAALGGYTGIAPRWTVDLLGDHNRTGVLSRLFLLQQERLLAGPAFFDLLEALSVGWLILPSRSPQARLEHVTSVGGAELYRLPGVLPRVRVVDRARMAGSPAEFGRLLESRSLDLRREAVLHEPQAAAVIAGLGHTAAAPAAAGTAQIAREGATEIVVDAVSPRGGLLLLADTWYPGWEALVDDRPAPLLRANLAQRAVPLPPGNHRVTFRYRPRQVLIGLMLSAAGATLLLCVALSQARRHGGGLRARRRDSEA